MSGVSDNPYRMRLEKLIHQAHAERANQVVLGSCTSLEHYREQIGHLQGLQVALELCARAEIEINREDE